MHVQSVRDATLRGLLCIADCLPKHLEDPDNALDLTKRLLLATFDVSEDNKYVSVTTSFVLNCRI